MKTMQLLCTALFIGLLSTSLMGQTKAEYLAFMQKNVGEWHMDKSQSTFSGSDQVPDIMMTYEIQGEMGVREMKVKTPEGWQSIWVYKESFDATKKQLVYSNNDPRLGALNGYMTLQGNGKMKIEEYNKDNKMTSRITLSQLGDDKMMAEGTDFFDEAGNVKSEVVSSFKMVMKKK